jgi:hypothetical protein
MPTIEQELLEAISSRNAAAVELAGVLLNLARQSNGRGAWSWIATSGLLGGHLSRAAADIEALTAVIMQRSGISWDAMAAPLEVSKQAMHRRLADRGEWLFQDAISTPEYRTTYATTLTEALKLLRRARSHRTRLRVLEELDDILEFETRDMMRALYLLPDPADVVMAPTKLAPALSDLRHQPRWWWNEPDPFI